MRSICPYCGVGCGVIVEVRRGRVAGVTGDPDHPTNRGGLCAKGEHLAEVVRTPDRLLHPWVGGRRATWDEAIAAVVAGIRSALDRGGPEAIAFYLSGQLLTEDYYVANKLGKGLLGTANVDTNSRLCMSSTVAAYKRAFGVDGPPGCYEDLEMATHVFFWGSNAAETHPVLYGRLASARRRQCQHWTVIDPRRTVTAAAADIHLALRPGSDVALALGMMATLFQESLIDEAAVRRRCSGLDELRAAALAIPPEQAAAICGIEPHHIRDAARRMAAAPAALSLWCQGLNQSSAGTDKVNAVIDLHLLTGQIGRPGASPFSLTGQANAMGGREVGGLATELAAHHQFDSAADRAAVERFWGLGPVPSQRGRTAVEMLDAIAAGEIRFLWVVCTNPLASLPDGRVARAAFERLDTLVVQEIHHPTATSALADVVLPAAAWGEKTGTLTNSERRVALAEAAVAPPGEARPDWEIFAAVGRALGGGRGFDWPDPGAVFAEHVALTRGRDLDMTGLSYEILRHQGPQQWPFPEGGEPVARRYADGRYPTPDGRARLVPVAYRPPAEGCDARYPLHLTTGRLRDQWHTMTRTGRVAVLRRGAEETVVTVSADDARRYGLADRGEAVVASARGGVRARVHVDPEQPSGVVFLPFHRGPLHDPEGWPNALTVRALDPLSLQPELKHAAVRLEPAPRELVLGGGILAREVARRLRQRGWQVHLLSDPFALPGEAPPSRSSYVRRVHLPGDLEPGAVPWWEVVEGGDSRPGGLGSGVWPRDAARPPAALVDLTAGPEPLVALPILRAAGWRVTRRGDGGIPEPVLGLLSGYFAPGGSDGVEEFDLVVAAPRARSLPAGAIGAIVLVPGQSVGGQGPLSGDPVALAAYIAGEAPLRVALRRVVVPLGSRAVVVVGRPWPSATTDCVVYEDRAQGHAQVWVLTAGELIGAAAVVELVVAEDIERLWLADVEPALLRARLPLR